MYAQETIPERLSDASMQRHEAQRKRRAEAFVKGPIPAAWLARAVVLPGKALAVAMVIWFESGRRGSRRDLVICNSLLRQFNVERQAGYRGLAALEMAGLVTVDRHRGRCPRVTIRAVWAARWVLGEPPNSRMIRGASTKLN